MKHIGVFIAAFIAVECMPQPTPASGATSVSEEIPAGLNGRDKIQPGVDISDNGQLSISEKQSTYQERNNESSDHEAQSGAYSDGKGNSVSHSKESDTTNSESEKEKNTDTKTLALGTDGLSSTHETDTTQQRDTSDTARGSESFNQQTGDGHDHVHKYSSGSEYGNSSQTHDKSNKNTKDAFFLEPNLETKKEHQESKTDEHDEKQTARGSSYENREDHDKDEGRIENGESKSHNSYNNEAAKSSSNSSVSNTQENSNGENSNESDVNIERGGDLVNPIGIRQGSDSNAETEVADKTNQDSNVETETNIQGTHSAQQEDTVGQTDVVSNDATQSVGAIDTGLNGSYDQHDETNTKTEVNTNTRGEESTQGDSGIIVVGTNGDKRQEKEGGTEGGSVSIVGGINGDQKQEQKVNAETGGETEVSNEANRKFEIGSSMKFGTGDKWKGRKRNHKVKTGQKTLFHKDVLRLLDKNERALGLVRDGRSTSSESMEKSHSAIDVSKLRKEYLLSVAQNIHNSKIVSDGHDQARIVSLHHPSKHHSHRNLVQRYGVSPVGSHYANVQYVEERFGNLSSLINAGTIFAKLHGSTQKTVNSTDMLQNSVRNVFDDYNKRQHRTGHSLANLHLSPSEWQELFKKEVEQKNAEHNGFHRSQGTGYARVFKLDPIVRDAIISRNLDDILKSPHKRKFRTTMISVSKEKDHNLIPNRKIQHFSTKKQRIVLPKSKADDVTIHRNTETLNHATVDDSNVIPPKPDFEVSSNSYDATKDLISHIQDGNAGFTRGSLETKMISRQIAENTLDSSVYTNPERSNRLKNNQNYEAIYPFKRSVPLEKTTSESYDVAESPASIGNLPDINASVNISSQGDTKEMLKRSVELDHKLDKTVLHNQYLNKSSNETDLPEVNLVTTKEKNESEIYDPSNVAEHAASISDVSDIRASADSTSHVVPKDVEIQSVEFDRQVDKSVSHNEDLNNSSNKSYLSGVNLNTTKIVEKNESEIYDKTNVATNIGNVSDMIAPVNSNSPVETTETLKPFVEPDQKIDETVSYNQYLNKSDNKIDPPVTNLTATNVEEINGSEIYDKTNVAEFATSMGNESDMIASVNSNSPVETTEISKSSVEPDQKIDETILYNQYLNKSDNKTDSTEGNLIPTKVVEKNESEINDKTNVAEFATSMGNEADMIVSVNSNSSVETTEISKSSVEPDQKIDETVSYNQYLNKSNNKTDSPVVNLIAAKVEEKNGSEIYDKTNVSEYAASNSNVSDKNASLNNTSQVVPKDVVIDSVESDRKIDESVSHNENLNNSSNKTYLLEVNLNTAKVVEQNGSEIYDKTNVAEFDTSISNVSDMIASVNSNSPVETTEITKLSVEVDQNIDESIPHNDDLNDSSNKTYLSGVNLNTTKVVEQNGSEIYDETNVAEFDTSIGNVSDMIASVNSNSPVETTEISKRSVEPDQKIDETVSYNQYLNKSNNKTDSTEVNLIATKFVEKNDSEINDETNVAEFATSIGNVSDMIASVNSDSPVETTEISKRSVEADQKIDESISHNEDLNNSSNKTYLSEVNLNTTKVVEQNESEIYDKTNVAEFDTSIGNVSDMIASVNSNSPVETTEISKRSVEPDKKIDETVSYNQYLNKSDNKTDLPEVNLIPIKVVEKNGSEIYDSSNVIEYAASNSNVSDINASRNNTSQVVPEDVVKKSVESDHNVDETILQIDDFNKSSNKSDTSIINAITTKVLQKDENNNYNTPNFAAYDDKVDFATINLITTKVVDKNESEINGILKVVESDANIISTTETNLSNNNISYAEPKDFFENSEYIKPMKIKKRNIDDTESSSDSETVTIEPNYITKNVTEKPLNMNVVIDKPIGDALFQLSNSANDADHFGEFNMSNISSILNEKNNSSTNLDIISSTTTQTPVIIYDTAVSENSIADSGKTERFSGSSVEYDEAHKHDNTNSKSNATKNTSYNNTKTSISKIPLDSKAFDMDNITSIVKTGIIKQSVNSNFVPESNINDAEVQSNINATIIGDKNQTLDSIVTENSNEAKNSTDYTNIETTSKLDTNKTESLSNDIMDNITSIKENNTLNDSNIIVLSDANASVTSKQASLNKTDVTVDEIATANSSNIDNKLLDLDNSIRQTSKRDLNLVEEPITEAKDTGNFDYTPVSRADFTSTAVVNSDNHTTTDWRLGDNNKTEKLVTVITSERLPIVESEKVLPIDKPDHSTPTVYSKNRLKAKTNKLIKTVKSDRKNEISKSEKEDSTSKSEESSSRSGERLIYASNIESVNTDDSASSSFESLVR